MQQEQKMTWRQRLLAFIRMLLLDADFHATELQSGLVAGAWGIVLGNPTWNTFAASPQYWHAMADRAPEWLWGCLMFALGAVQVVGMAFNVYWLRRVGLFALTCLWAFLSTMLFINNYSTPSPYLHMIFALSSAWAYWRLSLHRKV